MRAGGWRLVLEDLTNLISAPLDGTEKRPRVRREIPIPPEGLFGVRFGCNWLEVSVLPPKKDEKGEADASD